MSSETTGNKGIEGHHRFMRSRKNTRNRDEMDVECDTLRMNE